jgi:Binding-prot-dependent transport system membrane comp, N-term/Binding-protein-dependent transport system inner membrane component
LPTSGPSRRRIIAGRSRRLPSGRFLRFVLRRLAALVPLGVGVTLVSFVLTQLVPGDPAAANLGQRAIGDPAAVQAFRQRYGLDQPLPVQYGRYLERLAHGDLGDSQQSHRPVRQDLAEFVPATPELAGLAILYLPDLRDLAGAAGGDAPGPAGRLRAALVPIVTVAGVAFGSLLSGTVLVESIFSWPGVGQYAFRSATNLDLPAIMGVSLFVAVVKSPSTSWWTCCTASSTRGSGWMTEQVARPQAPASGRRAGWHGRPGGSRSR